MGRERSRGNQCEEIFSFPKRPWSSISTLVKSCQQERKQELAEHIVIWDSRRGFQLTEKLPWEKQNQTEKTEASKDPGKKNFQPKSQGVDPHLTKRARKKFSSPGNQKVNFHFETKNKGQESGIERISTRNKESGRKTYSPVGTLQRKKPGPLTQLLEYTENLKNQNLSMDCHLGHWFKSWTLNNQTGMKTESSKVLGVMA